MASFLAIDWDQGQLHLVSATVSRGRVQIKRAVVVDEHQSPDTGDVAQLGQRLRQWIKDTGVAPAPVLACLGRDRVILKEVRYPHVPAHEEPDIVRFQVSKELTESMDSVVVDYVRLDSLSTATEKRALAFIINRKVVTKYEEICRAASLRLAALIPRPFGLAACLHRVIGSTPTSPAPEPPGAPVALVTLGDRWAEFCVVRGEDVLLTRSLTPGPGLAGEIRRNLAVYGAQSRQDPVRAVYLALGSAHPELRGQLQDRLDVPVHPFDPFAGEEGDELPSSSRGSFAGAVGMLHGKSQQQDKPINFTKPKESRVHASETRRISVLAVVLGLIVIAGGLFLAHHELVAKPQLQVQAQQRLLKQAQDEVAALKGEQLQMKQLAEWDKVVWLDELYDLAERLPKPGDGKFHFKSIEGRYDADVHAHQRGVKLKPNDYNAELILKGYASEADRVYQLRKLFENERLKDESGNVIAQLPPYRTKPVKTGMRGDFTAHVRIKKRDPEHYVKRLSNDQDKKEEQRKLTPEEIDRELEKLLGAPP